VRADGAPVLLDCLGDQTLYSVVDK
jgi:hypothetical protein